jgi:prepilin-type N-terminal cleavage/methylation domain-containing protein
MRRAGSGRLSGSHRRGGFTLVELLIGIVVAAVILGGMYQVQVAQSRMYGQQREVMDARGSLKAAAALLVWEIRQASAADGDIYAIGANSISLRSVQGVGTLCVKDSTLARFGIIGTPAAMAATSDDSVLVFTGYSWQVLRVATVGTPASLGVGNCDWPGGPVPDIAVALTVAVPGDTVGIAVGSPIRAFRRVEYGIYQDAMDGRWWLGRKVGAAASYEKLIGPLQSQGSGGLLLTYQDASGAATADPTQVASVDLTLRAESYGQPPGQSSYEVDSLTTRVALRN